jgi:3-(3-hydroxy-phenyl)propionate hydroxylase
VERFADVQVHLGHELVSLEQSDDLVQAQVRRVHDGAGLQFTARYAIACDGARSSVRRQMGGQIEDLAFDEWWIVVDAWLRTDTELPSRCVQYCRPSRPGTYIVGPNDLRRWEIKMLPGETPEQFQTEAAIRRVLADFTDPDALDLCRTAIYRFHALVAQQWRFGRVFLMGDAAHQMPPFLGQGLCAAIRDTVNLAWKIEAVERLGASPTLLDTYGEERTPHVRTVVSHAKSFGLIIGELDEAKARQRDAEMEALLQSGQAETVRQKFIPGLSSGLIALDSTGAALPGAGTLFPQPWVQAQAQAPWRRLDDLTRGGFLIVSNQAEAPAWIGQAAQAFWQRVQGQCVLVGTTDSTSAQPNVLALQERDGLLAQTFAQLEASVLVVRPDRYVYGSANSPAELQSLLAALENALFDAPAAQPPQPATEMAMSA